MTTGGPAVRGVNVRMKKIESEVYTPPPKKTIDVGELVQKIQQFSWVIHFAQTRTMKSSSWIYKVILLTAVHLLLFSVDGWNAGRDLFSYETELDLADTLS